MYFSQCVVCMFGHKKIYKVTNLKVHSKGIYFLFKKSLFKNYNEWLVWTTKLFSCICDVTKINPANGNSNGWGVGRTLGWALHVSKSKPGAGVFISLYFWRKPTVFRKLWMSFKLFAKGRGSTETPSKLFANHNALGQLTNHNTFRFSEGGPSSNPELIEPFVPGWGERYCNNVNYVKK